MKQSNALLSLVLVLALIYYSFSSLMPRATNSLSLSETEFSTERALIPLREIAKAPHYYGSTDHKRVRAYLENELIGLGFETEIQEGYVLNPEWRKMNKPKNILGRIKGSGSGKSLLLLSHYDSALVPSFGASDAGSGVVTILESLRAYLALNKAPINDIIVLFTDC
jgi:acetylornithine deacetylase/succinyl-diaminopimelate desuccinylase-like protein